MLEPEKRLHLLVCDKYIELSYISQVHLPTPFKCGTMVFKDVEAFLY